MRIRSLLALACSAHLILAHASQAAAIGVSPILLELSAKRATRVLEVSNPSGQAVHIQIRLFAWSGGGTEERYTPSQDVGFSPPMFELAPGQKQVVRLAIQNAPTQEMSYRLFVDQIDAPIMVGDVAMPVRMALPLFILPEIQAPGVVDWRIETDETGPLLVARNRGGRRVRLTNLEGEGPDGVTSVATGLAGYVLAGQERRWRLKSGAPRPWAIRALTDHGPITAQVSPD